MTLIISKVPREVWPTNANDSGDVPLVSDLRAVSYWMMDGVGLARQEIKTATSQEFVNQLEQQLTYPSDPQYLLAAEVRSVSFRYWDGTEWNDTWDSTQFGPDGITPIGPPIAVEVTLGLEAPRNMTNREDLRYYTHVYAVTAANGMTSQITSANGTTQTPSNAPSGSAQQSTTGSGTSP
jgi:hypothetical protein